MLTLGSSREGRRQSLLEGTEQGKESNAADLMFGPILRLLVKIGSKPPSPESQSEVSGFQSEQNPVETSVGF